MAQPTDPETPQPPWTTHRFIVGFSAGGEPPAVARVMAAKREVPEHRTIPEPIQ